jgi:predicted transcriptional regulator
MGEEGRQLQGETQIALMRAVWRTGGGAVEDIRDALPEEYQSGYKTIQTLLNRLADRGLLIRTPGRTARGPSGKILYRPALTEEEYLTEAIARTLEEASPEARDVAVTNLIGRFEKRGRGKGRQHKKRGKK